MKLLIGRLVLGCITAVLVAAEGSVVNLTTDALSKSNPSTVIPTVKSTVTETPLNPLKNLRGYSKPADNKNGPKGVVIIHDQEAPHHDHGYPVHENDHHHDHDHHHPPPHHHHHDHYQPPPPPPPHHHPYPQPYPGYYPPSYPSHYPMPYPNGIPHGFNPVPPQYPYYPQPNYYAPPAKQASVMPTNPTPSSSGQVFPKPTDLLNQGTEYLWNLFGKLGTVDIAGHDNGMQEVVLINTKPAPQAPGSTPTMQLMTPTWFNKAKNIPAPDCNNKKENPK